VARLETVLEAANILIEPSQKSSRYGLYITRTLVRARPRLSVCIMNVTNKDQVLNEGTNLGHGEPAIWAAATDDQDPQPRRKGSTSN
jgi:hypothetical protein